MKATEIILIATALLVVAIRLYKKYSEKNRPGGGTGKQAYSGDSFHSAGRDDDYEPYAGRRK